MADDNTNIDLFSTRIDDELYKLFEQKMNTQEQKLFVKSFYLYLEYGNDDRAFVINLDNIWEWVGFTRKDNAKVVLKKNFIENKHYKCLLLQVQEQKNKDDNRGGHNKETIMMTVSTFKKFCMKASTKRADEICDYYLKMENVMQEYIKKKLEEKNNLMIEMEKLIEEKDSIIDNERTQYLIDCYDKQLVVYIVKILSIDDDKYIIKIGKTDNIKDRIQALSSYFGCKVTCLNIYPCEKSYQLEQDLHNDPRLLAIKYTDIINNKSKSTETYLIKNKNIYKQIKNIIKEKLNKFQSLEHLRLRTIQLEYETFSKVCNSKDDLLELMKYSLFRNLSIEKNTESGIESIIDKDENSDSADIMNESNTNSESVENDNSSTSTKTYGPRVQVYDKNDLTKVLFVFEGITEATRQIDGASFTHIKFVSKNKLEYLGYRWFLLDRKEPNPNLPRDIGETVTTQTKKTGFVAMINLEKTKIEKVFTLQKEAAEYINQHSTAICSAIKYSNHVGGYYWIMWDDVNEELKNKYLQENTLPNAPKNTRGATVQKIDAKTNQVLEIFDSISEASKKMKISPRTFKSASANNSTYSGFKWKIV